MMSGVSWASMRLISSFSASFLRFSRPISSMSGRGEIAIAFNTSLQPLSTVMEVDAVSRRFSALYGHCESEVSAPGSYRVVLAPLDFVVCAAGDDE